MDKEEAMPQRGKIRAKTGQKAPTNDLFTILCKTDIGVNVVRELQFHPKRKWRFDYAIPEHLIAIEVEGGVWTGGRHTRAPGFLKDMEKYNTAAEMGWRLLRVTPTTLCTSQTLDMIRKTIFFAPIMIKI